MKKMSPDRRKESFYANKVILAPMVRVGTLPMRLLSLRYGADLVYSEEIIDFKLIKSRRYVNEESKTIDFIDESGFVVFRTNDEEKSKVIVQIGTNDPTRAVLAAKMVEDDVAGIDINMGCPKSFSLKGGMGAALLTNPDMIHDILTQLKANIKKPVSCKIRVLPDLNATLDLVRMIQKTGVDAIAVHGRTKDERPRDPNRDEFIRAIVDNVQIPVIANGASSEIRCYSDIEKFKTRVRASSVMIARAAMKNCSLFDKNGKRVNDIEDLIKQYLRLSIQFDNNAMNTKYCIQQMLGPLQELDRGKQFIGSYDLETMSKIYELHEYYIQTEDERNSKKIVPNDLPKPMVNKEGQIDVIELPIVFDKNLFEFKTLPKNILNRFITQNKMERPKIRTYQVEKQYHSVIQFMDKTYSTPYLEKAKRLSEQSATLVLLISLGLFADRSVIDKCLVSEHNIVHALQHFENGKVYYIKINK